MNRDEFQIWDFRFQRKAYEGFPGVRGEAGHERGTEAEAPDFPSLMWRLKPRPTKQKKPRVARQRRPRDLSYTNSMNTVSLTEAEDVN